MIKREQKFGENKNFLFRESNDRRNEQDAGDGRRERKNEKSLAMEGLEMARKIYNGSSTRIQTNTNQNGRTSTMRKDTGYIRKFDDKALRDIMDSVISYVAPVKISLPSKSDESEKDLQSPGSYDDNLNDGDTQQSNYENAVEKQYNDDGNDSDETRSLEDSDSTEVVVEESIKEPFVTIHVFDEARRVNKDFSCPKSHLTENIKYFANSMLEQDIETFDISIHCDVEVFSWIMSWIKWYSFERKLNENDEKFEENPFVCPGLSIKNVLKIITTASFLGIEPLVDLGLRFCHDHLAEIIEISQNFNCLDDKLIKRLASLFSNSELDSIKDDNDLITPHLWIQMIQNLCQVKVKNHQGHFYSIKHIIRCHHCKQIIVPSIKHSMPCKRSNLKINRWGQFYYHHVCDPEWNINKFILNLFHTMRSWRNVYWKLWTYSHLLYCRKCRKYFPISQMNFCKQHSGDIVYDEDKSFHKYSCCKKLCHPMELYSNADGCHYDAHTIDIKNERDAAIFNILQNLKDLEENFETPNILPKTTSSSKLTKIELPLSKLFPKRRFLLPSEITFSGSLQTKPVEQTPVEVPDEKNPPAKPTRNASPMRSPTRKCKKDPKEESPKSQLFKFNKIKVRKYSDPLSGAWTKHENRRINQDQQRELEEKLMKNLIHIVENKIGIKDSSNQEKKTNAGGSFVQLEADWKKEYQARCEAEEKIPPPEQKPRPKKFILS